MDNINKKTIIQESSLDGSELTIRDYLFIIKLHYKTITFCTIFGLGLALYNVLMTPPSYIATATIVIQEIPGANMIMDLTGNRERNRIINEVQLIKSRAVAENTIQAIWPRYKNNLALFGSFPFHPRGRRIRTLLKELFTFGIYNPDSDASIIYTEPYSDKIGENFSSELISRISVNPRQGTNIIDVSYTSVWPEEAKMIVNRIVDVFQELDKKWSSEKAFETVDFLEDLVKNQEMKLNQAEEKFTNFKKTERLYNLNGYAMTLTEQIASIESEMYNSFGEINIREEKYNLLKSKLSQDEKELATQLMNTINIQVVSLRNEISQLEASLIQNVAQYGETHGAVKDLKKKLDALKLKLNSKVHELTKQGVIVQDPLKSRSDIITELISLDSEIVGLKLNNSESKKLIDIYDEKLNSLPKKQLQFSKLQRNSNVLSQNYVLLRQKLEEAKINVASQVGKVQIVDYSRTSGMSGQNKNKKMAMGISLGLGIGIIIAFMIEYFDNTIKTAHDIERKGLSVLGIIPSIGEVQIYKKRKLFDAKNSLISSKSTSKLKRRLITREDPRSPVSEAYRSLRTSMLFSSPDKKIKSILISSAGPGEGKTTTVANLAITYANLGKKTLLIDTDLRRPVVHKVLDLNKEPGITDYLSGANNNFNSLVQDTEINNLSAVPSGIIPPNPSELLGSQRMITLLKTLEKEWDMILFDSPPLVAVTDATMVSQEIDQIVMVVKVGQTDKKAFDHTITSLRNVNVPLGGVILNAVTHKNSYGSYYYYYQYYHYYGGESEAEEA